MTKIQLYGFESFLHALTIPRLNKKIIKIQGNELATMAAKLGVASMSMNQYKSIERLFVILRKDLLIKGQWKNYTFKSNSYNFYANPKIVDKNLQQQTDWEQCPSYPGISLKIKRSTSIKVSYFNAQINEIKQEMTGFQSRLFQHQISHNEGQDLLRTCQDIRIDQNVKKQDGQIVMKKWLQYKNGKNQNNSREQIFKLMKRDYVYRIVDQYK